MNALSAQIKKINTKDKFLLFIVSFFPVTFILGNLFINTFIIILSLGFFINLDENKKFFFIKEIKPLYLLFFSLLINLIFSINILNSLPRITKIIFVIIFVMEIIRLLRKHEEFFTKYVLKFWSLLVLIITFDCYFEYFSGQNLIGNTSAMQGRLSSFFGDELVAGAFIYGFALYFLSYLILSNKKKEIIIFSIIFIIY